MVVVTMAFVLLTCGAVGIVAATGLCVAWVTAVAGVVVKVTTLGLDDSVFTSNSCVQENWQRYEKKAAFLRSLKIFFIWNSPTKLERLTGMVLFSL